MIWWRNSFLWAKWLLASFFSALVAVPLAFALAALVFYLLSVLLFFLWVIGALIGIIAGGALGGAMAGRIISEVQFATLPSKDKFQERWTRGASIAGALVGGLCITNIVPILNGELSPVIPLAVLGEIIGRGASDTILTAAGSREALDEVKGLRAVDFDGTLLFFVTKRDLRNNARWELWTSDGTAEGTTLVKPGYTGWNEPSIRHLMLINKTLFFRINGTEDKADAQSWKNGESLWRTDGTTSGTSRLTIDSRSFDAITANQRIIYTSIGLQPCELWASGSTNNCQGTGVPNGSQLCELWVSDGNATGTSKVTTFNDICPSQLTVLSDTLFFELIRPVPGSSGCALWKSDGTGAGIQPIREFGPPDISCISDMAVVSNRLLFTVAKIGTSELWISDGTAAGTILLRSFPGRSEERDVLEFRVTSDKIFFTTYPDDIKVCMLWASDGTAEGTVQIPLNTCRIGRSIVVGDTLMFLVESSDNNWELWLSDGTSQGTVLLRGGFTTGNQFIPSFLVADDTTAYLKVHDLEGCALWKSDGTPTGTVEIRRGCPEHAAIVNNMLYFIMQRGEREIELWKSDGTPDGTVLVKVIS